MTGNYLNKILSIDAKHALYREDGKWYHNLTRFPGVLFDKNGFVTFYKEDDYLLNPSLQIKKDFHITDDIENLANYLKFSKREKELIIGVGFVGEEKANDEEKTIRIIREIEIILRKKKIVEKIKKLYNNTCQICGIRIPAGGNNFYSEVHHIIPLGNPHNGKDSLNNMICVCPNHHVQLDIKSIALERNHLYLNYHPISKQSIDYHNKLVKQKAFNI